MRHRASLGLCCLVVAALAITGGLGSEFKVLVSQLVDLVRRHGSSNALSDATARFQLSEYVRGDRSVSTISGF